MNNEYTLLFVNIYLNYGFDIAIGLVQTGQLKNEGC